ncbi:hypothetical protein Lfu02_70570 [Longispora fulva]|uniref:GH18 domain-containing protein n=1 Tax=Longispora fulva TaxID=619741 RepID=A0A8J7GML4_9ACTN|nr:carbohydrate binding domain-containing protein [Longispora fulva]MBG6134398.1 hypothetical protein [Longispora fulva]GIG62685.1 hypothetical protein Lfu02_70570 [Longispora fulva]
MRRPVLLTLLAVAATALGAALAVTVPALADAASVTNPGFETGTLSGWNCDPTDSVVTGHARSGSYALAGAADGGSTAQCTQTVPVLANTSYTLTAQVNGSYVYLGITGGASTWTPGTSGGYSALSVAFTSGSATSVIIYLHGWYGQGTYYADDVALAGPAGNPSPSASPSPSPTASPSPTPTTPPGNGSFPNPIYLMPLENNPQNISTAISASGAKNYNLAFILDSGGCTPAWGGDPAHPVAGDTTVTGVVSAIRSAGGDVAVSFGGYNGTELGATCGGSGALAAAYQKVIDKYSLTRIDLDYEGDDLDANMAVRFGAIRVLQQNNPNLKVSLTIPATTVGFPDSGKDELRQAATAGARLDLVNLMAFDYGLTNASDQVTSVQLVAEAAKNQIKAVYGIDDATAWARLGLQLMNGHTDQPSELFTVDTFRSLLAYAQAKHVGWFSYWSLNRDRACDPGVPHNWADGTCSSVDQQPYDFSKVIAQYRG